MVRCSDKATAQAVKPKAIPEMIFLDGDGEEIYRASVRNKASVLRAMKEANKRYTSKKVSWASGNISDIIAKGREEGKPVILAFTDDKKNSEKFIQSLQHRWIAKHHDKFYFVRAPYERNSELCKEWGVKSAPTVLFVNPLKDGKKQVQDKIRSKTKVTQIRVFLLKNLQKFNKALEE